MLVGIALALGPAAALAEEGGAPPGDEAKGGEGGGAMLDYVVGCVENTDCGDHQICTGSPDAPGACVALADALDLPESALPEEAPSSDEAPRCAVTSPGTAAGDSPLPFGLLLAGALLLAGGRRTWGKVRRCAPRSPRSPA